MKKKHLLILLSCLAVFVILFSVGCMKKPVEEGTIEKRNFELYMYLMVFVGIAIAPFLIAGICLLVNGIRGLKRKEGRKAGSTVCVCLGSTFLFIFTMAFVPCFARGIQLHQATIVDDSAAREISTPEGLAKHATRNDKLIIGTESAYNFDGSMQGQFLSIKNYKKVTENQIHNAITGISPNNYLRYQMYMGIDREYSSEPTPFYSTITVYPSGYLVINAQPRMTLHRSYYYRIDSNVATNIFEHARDMIYDYDVARTDAMRKAETEGKMNYFLDAASRVDSVKCTFVNTEGRHAFNFYSFTADILKVPDYYVMDAHETYYYDEVFVYNNIDTTALLVDQIKTVSSLTIPWTYRLYMYPDGGHALVKLTYYFADRNNNNYSMDFFYGFPTYKDAEDLVDGINQSYFSTSNVPEMDGKSI